MSTWILVLTIQWGTFGYMHNATKAVALDHITGFRSKADCERAGELLRGTNSLLQAVCIEQSK